MESPVVIVALNAKDPTVTVTKYHVMMLAHFAIVCIYGSTADDGCFGGTGIDP